MVTLRPYQRSSVNNVIKHWHAGIGRVCLVAPTGSGKSIMGGEVVLRARTAGADVLWVAHRRELIEQAADHARRRIPDEEVGIVCPGSPSTPLRPVQVCTVQSLLARGRRPRANLVVWDECHHYVSDDWSRLAEAYPGARHLGLTATPERSDGRPLGDMFDQLVVAASYSQLLQDGYLAPCRAFRAIEATGSDLALNPVEAYRRHAEDSRAFLFAGSVEMAYKFSREFSSAGIPAKVVEANTPLEDRQQAIKDFRAGSVRVLCNVYALTEGVDVPQARTIILARNVTHVTPYLQMAGRVLRTHESKQDAILLDLTGATEKHGLPTEDRRYSLSGRGISREGSKPIHTCQVCGHCWIGARKCPACGFEPPPPKVRRPKIYSAELREVYAGSATPHQAKVDQRNRLRNYAREHGYSLGWVAREYRRLFNEEPNFSDIPEAQKYAEWGRLISLAMKKGWKPGYAKLMFRKTFGYWPPKHYYG